MVMAPEAGQNFLSETNSGSYSSPPRPTSHTGRLYSLGTEDPGRDMGAAQAFFCHLLSGPELEMVLGTEGPSSPCLEGE